MAHTPKAETSPPENVSPLDNMVMLEEFKRFPKVFFPKAKMAEPNREAWLQTLSHPLSQAARKIAEREGIELDVVTADIGFDFAVAPLTAQNCIGICRHHHAHEGKVRIQIDSGLECPILVAHVLLHEIVHAYTVGDGQKGRFRKLMKALDSDGKMTATTAGEEQAEWLTYVLSHLPEWSDMHKPFTVPKRGKRGKGSRLLKFECFECGCVFRITRKWAFGFMRCPVGSCGGEAVEC